MKIVHIIPLSFPENTPKEAADFIGNTSSLPVSTPAPLISRWTPANLCRSKARCWLLWLQWCQASLLLQVNSHTAHLLPSHTIPAAAYWSHFLQRLGLGQDVLEVKFYVITVCNRTRWLDPSGWSPPSQPGLDMTESSKLPVLINGCQGSA